MQYDLDNLAQMIMHLRFFANDFAAVAMHAVVALRSAWASGNGVKVFANNAKQMHNTRSFALRFVSLN